MDKPRLFAFVLAMLLPSVAVGWWPASDPKTPSELEDTTALMLARLCVNEEGWNSPDGCKAIWDVVLNVKSGRCDPTRARPGKMPVSLCMSADQVIPPRGRVVTHAKEVPLSAMRRIARRVTGMVPPSNPHQAWTSTLQDSSQPPQNWRECGALPAGAPCDGTWARYVRPWSRVRALARTLVRSGRPALQCPPGGQQRVIAWGGEMDHWLALRRGLVEVDCGDTRNRFYARGTRQLPTS